MKGRRLRRDGVYKIIVTIGEAAEVEDCHPHRFRHTCAANAVRAGIGLLQLQEILGHASLEMTRRYVKLVQNESDRITQAQRSPLDHMKLRL